MLENTALVLMAQSESVLMLLGIALVLAGFMVGLITRRGATLSLRRVPYFIWSAVVFALVSAAPFAWLLSFEAMQNDILWTLVALVFGSIFVAGFFFGVLGHARSVNAYGDAGKAWMAIVPLFNLLLLFKGPQDWEQSSFKAIALNALGSIFGLCLLVLGVGIEHIATEQSLALASRIENDPEFISRSIAASIRRKGLEATLLEMATDVPSRRIDESTILKRVENEGTTLRYVYEVSADTPSLSASTSIALVNQVCGDAILHPLIEAGGTLEFVYLHGDGTKADTVAVTLESCGL